MADMTLHWSQLSPSELATFVPAMTIGEIATVGFQGRLAVAIHAATEPHSTKPIEDAVGTMADLVGEGKVRFLGLSEAAPATSFQRNTGSLARIHRYASRAPPSSS